MTERPVRTEMPNAIELSVVNKFRREIWTKFLKGIKEYQLIQEGDKIAVCISGGKDSMLMAMCMKRLQRYSKVPFEVVFLVMNPGYNEINYQKIRENAALLEIPVQVFETGIFDAVAKVDQHPCYLCARMRRGHLYKTAKELGCNKIALGHHFDDVIETILMGINSPVDSVPHILNLSVSGIKGEEMRRRLDERGVCVSVKSACSVPNTPSRAVMAISHDRKNAHSSWRISLSHLTTEQEIEQFTDILGQIISEG